MKLITDDLKQRFAEIGNQRENDNPTVVAKFFDPTGSATWYATEYDPETNICMGYVTGLGFDEWGSFSINELENVQLPLGLSIERDLYFAEIPFADMISEQTIEEKIEIQQEDIKVTEKIDMSLEKEEISAEAEENIQEPEIEQEPEVENEIEEIQFIHNDTPEQEEELER